MGPPTRSDFNVFVGAETGLLKGVSINAKCPIAKNFHSLKALSRSEEITALSWSDVQTQDELLLGLRNGSVKAFDTRDLAFTQCLEPPAVHPVVGVVRASDDTLVSAWQNGLVRVWRYQDEFDLHPIDEALQATPKWKRRQFPSEEARLKHLCLLQADRQLSQMRNHPVERHMMATGGRENDLQVWDLNRPETPVFRARNVAPDSLQLRVPVWVSGIAFPDPLSAQLVATANRHGHIRLYDLRLSRQRRPVAELFFPDEALTAISASPNPHQVIVGTSRGQMALFDFRKEVKGSQGLFRKYKGCVGAIKGLDCTPQGHFAVVGLDRFLRVYHVDQKKAVHAVYLKSRLNVVALRRDFDPQHMPEAPEAPPVALSEDEIEILEEIKEEPPETEDEAESLWAQLKVVGGSQKRKSALKSAESGSQKKKKKSQTPG
eukprot:maker-scaffold14_size734282-snap-gene-1.24 protein:Tk11279 transcript:maker-scaffold14_size734282-snap-gene-1.24-mRNA-1 annotation:"wd repeat-containing protein 74"